MNTCPALPPPDSQPPSPRPRPRRVAYLIGGHLFFALGLIGAVLPVMPTTVFWIVAAALFAKSSPLMYRRIVSWPGIGRAVEDFRNGGAIAPRGKVLAVLGMSVAAAAVLLSPLPAVFDSVSLAGIALGVVYVVSRPAPVDGRRRA